MRNGVFWDFTPCGFLRSVHRLLVTASVVPSSPILATLTEALSSSETSVLTRATWRNIPEDANLHSHRSENLKSYHSYIVYEQILSQDILFCISMLMQN
jgi:hypothetical protein